MPMLRTVQCNVCGHKETEATYGTGWHNWLHIQGAVLDGESDIWLCPTHMAQVMDGIDAMKNGSVVIGGGA